MSEDLLTSGEAARVLGVGASTVKRWADSGHLPCVKTLGKHRRFLRAEVEAFAEQSAADLSREALLVGAEYGAPRPLPADAPIALGPWLALLLGDSTAYDVRAMLMAERDARSSWCRVADAVGLVVQAVGDKWCEGTLSVIQEHFATEKLARGLAIVAESIEVPTRTKRCLLTTAQFDDHTLGLSLLEVCLRSLGWSTRWAGRRTPVCEIGRLVAEGTVDLVAVSASRASSDAGDLKRQVDELTQLCRPYGVSILLGGSGSWPEQLEYGDRLHNFASLERYVLGF